MRVADWKAFGNGELFFIRIWGRGQGKEAGKALF